MAVDEYNTNATGILASTGADYFGWEKVPAALESNMSASTKADLATFPADWPHYEIVIGDLPFQAGGNYAEFIGMLEAPIERGERTSCPSIVSPRAEPRADYVSRKHHHIFNRHKRPAGDQHKHLEQRHRPSCSRRPLQAHAGSRNHKGNGAHHRPGDIPRNVCTDRCPDPSMVARQRRTRLSRRLHL